MDRKSVAPCVGAWIEIDIKGHGGVDVAVAPCVGAWIEMLIQTARLRSGGIVAPCVGAWIEIGLKIPL